MTPSPSISSCGGDTVTTPCPLPTVDDLVASACPQTHPLVSPQQEQPRPRQRVGDGARGGAGGDGAARVRVWGDAGAWGHMGGQRGLGGTWGDTDTPSAASTSLPATTVLPASWHSAEDSRRPEDHGVKVEHVYQVGCCTRGCPSDRPLVPSSPRPLPGVTSPPSRSSTTRVPAPSAGSPCASLSPTGWVAASCSTCWSWTPRGA